MTETQVLQVGKDRNKKHNHLICIGHSFNIDNPYSGKQFRHTTMSCL